MGPLSLTLTLLFAQATLTYKLPSNLLSSLCYVESKHDVNAIHKDDGTSNSVGICQVKLKTARYLGFKGTEKQLMNPKTNIKYAAKYLAKQMLRYNSVERGVVAYNRGNARGLNSSGYSSKVMKEWNERR